MKFFAAKFVSEASSRTSNNKAGLPFLLLATIVICVLIERNGNQVSAIEIDGENYPDPDVGLVQLRIQKNKTEKISKFSIKNQNSFLGASSRSFSTGGFYLSSFRGTAYIAHRYCIASGRSLLSIQTDVKEKLLKLYIEDSGMQESLWTSGIRDVHQGGIWVWGNGEEIFYNRIENLNEVSTSFNCISLNTANYHMVVDFCRDRKFFVCEF